MAAGRRSDHGDRDARTALLAGHELQRAVEQSEETKRSADPRDPAVASQSGA